MENKTLIIILIAIIAVLLAMIGVILLEQSNSREESVIKITSDKTIYEGGSISVKLTDLNNTAISKEIVNIEITDKKGRIVFDNVVKTDSKGKAKVNPDLKKGKYLVNVSYDGNENCTGCNTTQKLTVKEKVAEAQTSSGSSADFYGPEVDSQGITREEAEARNMRYMEMTVDGDRPGEYETVGGYVAYDPNAGTYHT